MRSEFDVASHLHNTEIERMALSFFRREFDANISLPRNYGQYVRYIIIADKLPKGSVELEFEEIVPKVYTISIIDKNGE